MNGTAIRGHIRNNRIKTMLARISIYAGIFIIAYDYYLTFLTPFWDFDLLLGMFILGCCLVFVGFSGKLFRLGISRSGKIRYVRSGKCNACGACCRLPVRCIFLFRNHCLIYNHRPKQCRTFPSRPAQVMCHDCGYSFKIID